ncbi:CheR family methyltransferase [Geoalkalibacter halelectricus]|uniref:protein-glutamate O-methyltransferase n=1 Tax=Geoalkalibacter halelectricus TaxID=2847045 RepID=A0ABY5ZHL0_9BACT|nr:protein-glutamate O-methyltransferase CheR [Geoalkalibacter halelectricus]MDO3378087.1 protein-glutamate O-methyltransferase CheR [Geoalkalibacter halelectricus]UWZ78384.1 protein-glutamate O-methyltransferase CheR [Geoalkalibacter halelectricus]
MFEQRLESASALEAAGGGLMSISDEEFELLRRLIKSRFGINLTDQKKSLVVGRLQKLLRSTGFASFHAYYEHLVNDKNEGALSELINRISTNHTYFNREKAHFDYFQQTALPAVVERLRQEGSRDLRIWCAGCSSGEEAYTLQMLMLEYFGGDYGRWDAGILATDISERVLSIAQAGIYPQERVMQLPEGLQRKYFRRLPDGSSQVVESVRNEVTLRRFNLMNERFPFKKPFHIIFCRNVMIYFDQPTRETLVGKFHQLTVPGGYLFIGHSETLGRNHSLYRYVMPAVFQKGA